MLAGSCAGATWLAYLASSLLFIAGESNAVNLTDGIDGLAAGLFAIASVGLASKILAHPYSSPGIGLLCVSMAGAACGFLVHNSNPAKVKRGLSLLTEMKSIH